MNLQNLWRDYKSTVVTVATMLLFAVADILILLKADSQQQSLLLLISGAVQFLLAFVFIVVIAIRKKFAFRAFRKYVSRLSESMDYSRSKVVSNFAFPAVACRSDGSILWMSNKFLKRIAELPDDSDIVGDVFPYLGGKDLYEIVNAEESSVYFNNKAYSIYTNSFDFKGQISYVLYFVDNTSLRASEDKLISSRPVIVIVESDHPANVRYDFKDSERDEIRGAIQNEIDKWVADYSCITKRISSNRYLIVAEQRDVDKMIENRFSVLDKVRELKYKGTELGASLSIGVGDGDSFKNCEHNAKKALDMALGRGGDQAAVFLKGSYEFFGGVSKSVEVRNKVQSRVIGSALSKLIAGSDNVLIMGHAFSDNDCIGAAVGLCCACRAIGVEPYIVTDSEKSLAVNLIQKLKTDSNEKFRIIGEEKALKLLDKKSLLIVVDTHINSFVEFRSVLDAATTVCVIDHHRKNIDFIENAVLFHLDTGASSASEMVTEILQYIDPEPVISRLTAESLLSGIMLDTKNFVIRSRVRTFEAAAFLRDKGADTVSVRKLFSNSIESNRIKNQIVAQSFVYMNTAISVTETQTEDIRIICSQAADDMLYLEDVKASFVLYPLGEKICISARSLGEVNVQLLMESLGGGGHQTMAAAQFSGTKSDHITDILKNAIKAYFDNLNEKE